MELQELKKDINSDFQDFSTIHAILANYKITTKDIQFLKLKHPKVFNQLKVIFTQKIADLYELTINRPRQIQSMLKLIEAQERYFNQIFPEENIEGMNMPTIVITPSTPESSTRISAATILQKKD